MMRSGKPGANPVALSDHALLKAYRGGRVEALAELVERYKRPLFSYILHMTGGREDADEIFQEVWFRAVRKLSLYRRRHFLGWLIRIAHNLIIDRGRRRKDTLSLDQSAEDGTTLKERLPDRARDPAEDLALAELGARVRRAVAALPREQKEVFLMRTETGLPFREIARIQGVSLNTALGRMHYAIGKLRAVLKEDYALLGRGARPGEEPADELL